MEEDKEIEEFLFAVGKALSGVNQKTLWPLNIGQITAYFDLIEALDMHERLKKLKEKLTLEEISKLMPNAEVIRTFLTTNAIVGLKVAKKFEMASLTNEEVIENTKTLFEIIKNKVKSHPFCADGKNIVHDESYINKLISEICWEFPSSTEHQRNLANLIALANNLCYTLYYDVYKAGGFYIHGPYDASSFFGYRSILLIREYHNLSPREIWNEFDFPYKSIRIYSVYTTLEAHIDYFNHIASLESIGNKLIAYKILIDDKETEIKIEEILENLEKAIKKQSQHVKNLSDLDKVKKGAEIAFYLFKELREYMGDSWLPPKRVEAAINYFGDTFLKRFKSKSENPKIEHLKKIFDPRTDYF